MQKKQEKVDIDFPKLINNYKKDHFKTLPIINHEFLYSCLHPHNDSCGLALERNIYPLDLQIYSLEEADPSDQHHLNRKKTKLVEQDDGVVDEDEGKPDARAQLQNKPINGKEENNKKQDADDSIPKEALIGKLSREIAKEATKGQNDDDNKEEGKKDDKDQLKQKEFEFDTPIEYYEQKETQSSHNYRYAISQWDIRQGKYGVQVNEYGFNGTPAKNKFYMSHCGKFVYVFLQKKDDDGYVKLRKVMILSLDSFQKPKSFDLPEDCQIDPDELENSYLFNNSTTLVIKTNSAYYFIDTHTKQITWTLETEAKLDSGDTLFIKGVFCVEVDPAHVHIVVEKEADQHFYIFKGKLGEKNLNKLFDHNNQTHHLRVEVDLNEYYDIDASKTFRQLIFSNSTSMVTFDLRHGLKHEKFEYNGQGVIQKFPFLTDDIYFAVLRDGDDSFVSQAGIIKKNQIKNVDEYETNHVDVRPVKGGIMVLGTPSVESKNILVNYIDRAGVNITYIQEMSEIKCLYPYIFYCKGNQEIYIQSLLFPSKLIRLSLDDLFFCFVDINPTFKINYTCMKQNQTLTFLSQSDNKVFLNVLEFEQFMDKVTYKLTRSTTFIKRSEIGYGSIIKAAIMMGDDKKKQVEQDVVLVIQYRTQLIMKSFFTAYFEQVEKHNLINQPMIFLPNYPSKEEGESEYYFQPKDKIYFLAREGITVKMQRLCYNKETDPQETLYEGKAQQIYLFKHVKEYESQLDLFYIMDESLQVKGFKIDENRKKARTYSVQELSKSVKENWGVKEFEKIEMTEKTIYQQEFVTFLHYTEDLNKDYDIMQWETLFETNNYLVDGPIKVDGVKKLMYVVKGLDKAAYLDEDENKEKADPDDKIVRHDSISLEVESNIDIDKKGETQGYNSVNISERHYKELQKPAEEIKQRVNNAKKEVKLLPEEDNESLSDLGEEMYDEYKDGDIYDDERVEVLFMPLVDRNQVSLVYDNIDIDTKSRTFEFPLIKRSTFVDNENILAIIENKYMMFSKTGDFYGFVKFFSKGVEQKLTYDSMQLIYISDNLQNFLFYSWENNQGLLNVYNLKQKNSVWYFDFSESYKSQKDYSFYKYQNDNYFEQTIVTDNGKVIEIKWHYQLNEAQNNGGPEEYNDNQQERKAKFTFEIYINGNKMYDDIQNKLPVFKQEITQEQYDRIGFMFVNDYLFFKFGNELYYVRVLDYDQYQTAQFTKINLILNQNANIKRLVQTQHIPDHFDPNKKEMVRTHAYVQIVFVDTLEETNMESLYIVTWDLLTNLEHSLLQLTDLDPEVGHHYIVKGMHEKYNYIVTPDRFYDLQYLLPFTFLHSNGKEEDDLIQMSINEKKISGDKQIYLGVGALSNIHTGYNLHNLLYWEQITVEKTEDLESSQIHLEHIFQRYDQNTIFHKYALDTRIIQMIYDLVKKQDSGEKENLLMHLFFSLIYPNASLSCPFDIAMKEQSPKSIELMLNMFIELPKYRLSQFIRQHFPKLFTMGLKVFEDYLDICTFVNLSMESTKSLPWNIDQDEIFMDYHCSYISEDFLSKLGKKKLGSKQQPNKQIPLKPDPKPDENKPNPQPIKVSGGETERDDHMPLVSQNSPDKQQLLPHDNKLSVNNKGKSMIMKELTMYDHKLNEREDEENEDETWKRVEICALEFDWIFSGKEAKGFIKKLSETDNDNLFNITSIRIIILFLWQNYFYRILYLFFCPFVLYLTFFCLYVTYIYEQKVEAPGDHYWIVLDKYFVTSVCAFMAFFLGLEIRQMTLHKQYYFLSFWNNLDMVSISLNIAFIACDLSGVDPLKTRPLGSCAVGIMWIKFFYFLRLFSPTQFMIRLIMEVIYDMATFALVLAIAMVGFGNVFYILCVNNVDHIARQFNSDPANNGTLYSYTASDWFVGENNFLIALIYSFIQGTAGGGTYYGDQTEAWVWIIFLLEVILINIILLNLLVSILGDTFGRVTSISEQQKLKEMCGMIAEHEYLLNRDKKFKNSKYIIVAKLEKADAQSGVWEGQVNKLKSHFNIVMNEAKRETRLMIESLREEMLANYRGLDQKFNENQGLQSKTNQQLSDMFKEIRNISDKLAHGKFIPQQQHQDQNQHAAPHQDQHNAANANH